MATQIKKSKPTSPGRRFRSWVSRDDLHKYGPYAPLLEPKKQKSVKNEMKRLGLKYVDFKFYPNGSKILNLYDFIK